MSPFGMIGGGGGKTVFAELDGANTYYQRSDADFPEASITGDMTIQAWVMVDAVSAADKNDIVRKLNQNGQYSYLLRLDNMKLRIILSANGTALLGRETLLDVALPDTWVYVAVTYDASGSDALFYVDGLLVADDGAALPSSLRNGVSDFDVGSHVPTQTLDGSISNVALFDDIRTAGEILASASDPNEDLSTAGNIIGQWMFNDAPTVTRIDNAQGDAGRDLNLVGGDTTNYGTHSRTWGRGPA